jgi:SAM-dependent methyltransferase
MLINDDSIVLEAYMYLAPKPTYDESCPVDLRQRWFNSTVGQYLQTQEQALYDQAVFDLFGFNALQMGCLQMDLLRNSRMPNRYKAAECTETLFKSNVICCDDFLPFAETSLDLLLLPHCLEFSERPHQTLREAARVMMPEGHLLISGFNPLSTWGVTGKFNRFVYKNQSYPWSGKFIGLARLKDWLALMGFEILSVDMCCHVPPFDQSSWQKQAAFMDKLGARFCTMLGGVYFIVAKKRVLTMTPIKPIWKAATLSSSLIATPTRSKPAQKK